MTDLTVFDFFDNDLFVDANKERVLSDEDKVAIVIRSHYRSLNEKFEFLKNLLKTCNNELKEDVQKWINDMTNLVNYIKDINDSNIVFIIFESSNGGSFSTFSNFEKIMNCSLSNFIYCVHIHKLNKINRIGTIYFSENEKYIENKSILDYVSKIEISFPKRLPNAPVIDRKLYEHKVELTSPFKAYDYVYIPTVDGAFSQFIVADINDKFVQDMMNCEESEKSAREYCLYNGKYDWLKLQIPAYKFKNGDILYIYTHKYSYTDLAYIKKYSPSEIPNGILHEIAKIKSML